MNRAVVFLLVAGCWVGVLECRAEVGGVRGTVMDPDFEVPLPAVKVRVSETGQETETGDAGSYYLEDLEPGAYTLLFSKSGYTRSTESDVVVTPGQLTELDVELAGEYEEMDELVVRDIKLGGASEIGLLNLRMESSAMMDSIGADLMSQAGASDAAQALTLVPGTTIQDGKYAVVRGLPDRYVNSQMNGVRLPTADPDKRAVQLDQFPAAMIESVQVSKTFTPDQQGDASGGAVNIVLKGIPDERVLQFKIGTKFKSTVSDAGDGFLVDDGVSISFWGHDADDMGPSNTGSPWTGTFGVRRDDHPVMYDWSVMAGDKYELGSDFKVGFIGSFFYKRDAAFIENGVDDKYWIDDSTPYPNRLTPYAGGGAPYRSVNGEQVPSWGEDVNTSLFDVTQGTKELQWGALGGVGAETENHSLTLLYTYNFSAESTARLAEDTRGKYYFFPDHDPYDPNSQGGAASLWPRGREVDYSRYAPFRRTETLEYVERIANSLQLQGKHAFPIGDIGLGPVMTFKEPELDWTVARSASKMDTPDRRSTETYWYVNEDGQPQHSFYTGEGGITLLLRKWREVEETSTQYFTNLKLPFEAWNEEEGFLKFGVFDDQVDRSYDENSFYLPGSERSRIGNFVADWDEYWGETLSAQALLMEDSPYDVSYDGEQDLSAWYYMAEFPVATFLKLTGGARMEKTEISTAMRDVNPEAQLYLPSDDHQGFDFVGNEDQANAFIDRDDVLPALGFELKPLEQVTVRGSYAETVARMTFKELAPIQQVDNVGDDIFIGNPELGMSSLDNYDLRFDYNPYPGGLVSFSWFRKEVEDPIDYRQVLLGGAILATTADNYSEGLINGYEVEVRQSLGEWWRPLEGLDVGGNVTMIDSEIDASGAEIDKLREASLDDIISAEYSSDLKRDMMGAPEYLYNLNATYTVPGFGTELGLFYTVKGDALKAAGTQEGGNYIPHVYEKEYATLNFSVSQKFADRWKFGIKLKNLLDPEIESVYRSNYTGEEVVKKSYKKGIEVSLGLSGTW